MKKTLIENRLKNALNRLYYQDKILVENNAHERSITHKLAIHLGITFYEWNVDVEYNRNLGDVKRLHELTQNLLNRINNKEELVSGSKSVYPDIIVHKRNTSNNLLAIEVKKAHSTVDQDQFDKDKIKAYILEDSLNYQFAAFIKLGLITDKPKYKVILMTREEVLSQLAQGELNFG